MANRGISMRMVREILRLYYGLHLGKRQISRACGVSPSTVVDYVQKAQDKGITWPLPEDLDDAKLEAMLCERSNRIRTTHRPLPPMEEIHRELRKKGVTLQLLWLEYKERNSEGYQFTQFCEHYHRWEKNLEISLRQEHRAGEKMFIDFAGKGIPIADSLTGESTEAQIFVAVLGASNYTYVEALPSQSLPFWIKAHINAFEYFHGVSQILVPDYVPRNIIRHQDWEYAAIEGKRVDMRIQECLLSLTRIETYKVLAGILTAHAEKLQPELFAGNDRRRSAPVNFLFLPSFRIAWDKDAWCFDP